MNMNKKITALTAFWVFSGTAAAVGNIADMTLYDRAENRTLPVYHHEGCYYVVGKPGNAYQIRVRNASGADILAVVSVDGVNAVSGETANWGQTGYVLSPNQSYDINGWRKSLQRVAAFFFTDHENSYAARTGRPDNVGVIGVAVFRKKIEPEAFIHRDSQQPEARREAPANSSAGAGKSSAGASADAATENSMSRGVPASQPDNKLGTGHGHSQTSHVTYTEFERATTAPEEVIVVYYDTYRNLVAQGVIKAPRVATPFPGQFVPDPR